MMTEPPAPLLGAMRTRTRAKRERSGAPEPSRHVMVRQAWFGRPSAIGALGLTYVAAILSTVKVRAAADPHDRVSVKALPVRNAVLVP
jgi:hypothetical protein